MTKHTKFETDNFTRGGQLLSHRWRMFFQNMRVVMKCSMIAFVGGLLVGLLVHQPSFWLFDLYFCKYVGGWLKIMTWYPLIQPFLGWLDAFFRLMFHGTQGIPEAHLKVWQLVTELTLPNGSFFKMQTIKFLKDPRILALVFQVERLVFWGIGFFCLAFCVAWYVFWAKSKRMEEEKILRGKEVSSLSDLQKQIVKTGKSPFFIAPGLPYPLNAENQHTAIMGATRMGKTTCLIHLLKQIRHCRDRVVILDSTGELTAQFYRPGTDHLINPLDDRSECWNIWDENLETYGFDAWASGVIPDGKGDPFWHLTARSLLSATARKLQQDPHRSMNDLLDKACFAPLDETLAQFYAGTEAASVMSGNAEKMALGVRQHLTGYISAFKHLSTHREAFSVTHWVKQTKGSDQWLFLMATPDQRSTLAPLLASLFNFAFLGLERAGVDFTHRLWMAADEIAGWDFQISGLKRMVTEGAKYGACCVLGFQNKSQIDSLYTHAGTKTLLSNCSTKVIFRSQDHETAKDLSLTLGEQEVLSSSEGFSMGAHHMRDGVSLSEQRRIQPTIPATEIMSLNKLEAYVLLPGNFPATKVKFDVPS